MDPRDRFLTLLLPANKIIGFNKPEFGKYAWENLHNIDGKPSVAACIDVKSAGVHTLNVWMRAAGMRLDKIVLTTSSTYVPEGNGPAESTHDKTPPQ
jgi:hypothetical protein